MTNEQVVAWAVERWTAEVANRPLRNIHRRTLDDTWRQVIRHYGSDPDALCGPCHDDLLCAAAPAPVSIAEEPKLFPHIDAAEAYADMVGRVNRSTDKEIDDALSRARKP